MKIWAIMGGGDWADASVEHLILPDGIDIEAEHKNHLWWYYNEYFPEMKNYLNFTDWLKKLGAKEPTRDELECFEE